MSNLNGSETHDGSHPNKPNGRVDTNLHSDLIIDPVSKQSPGAVEIGFDRSAHKNCSEILWQNLSKKPDKIALIGPAGILTYREVIADAARWGNAFISAGVQRGERIAFLLDDTPTFIAAFYGAVRAGFVPVLMNIQTKPDVLAYFLKDADAKLAIVEGNLADVYSDVTREGLELPQTILVNTDVEHRFF